LDSDLVSDSGKIMTFNLLLSFFDQVTLCNATRPNHAHQNKRKQRAIADHTHMVAKTLSTHVSIVFTQVSVPAEEGSIIPIMGISHHPRHEHFTSSPSWSFHSMSYS
jgi:hypothetical protein